ncbi:MAG: YncE family protein [Bryobacteraceae bacterium]
MHYASSSPARLFFVVCKDLPGITIYDADTNAKVSQAVTPGIINPHEAAFSRDGRSVYVPIYGTSGVGKPGEHGHTLHIFDSLTGTERASLDTGQFRRPHCVTVGPETGTVYATAELAESFILIDPNRPAIIGSIPTGSNTSHMFALTRDERKAYVSNVRSKSISVLDVKARRLEATIPTEGENQRMTLSPDERWFVTNLGPAGKIGFFRTADNSLDFTVPVQGTPFVAKFSQDGRFLYGAGFAGPRKLATWKIDIASRAVIAIISEGLGEDPGSLEVNPFTGLVYVSDQPTDAIHQIDPNSWTVTGVIRTEKTPDAMGFVTLQ